MAATWAEEGVCVTLFFCQCLGGSRKRHSSNSKDRKKNIMNMTPQYLYHVVEVIVLLAVDSEQRERYHLLYGDGG